MTVKLVVICTSILLSGNLFNIWWDVDVKKNWLIMTIEVRWVSFLYNQTNIYSKNYVNSILINNEELSSTEQELRKVVRNLFLSSNSFYDKSFSSYLSINPVISILI